MSELFIATSNSPSWDPHDEIFGSQEAAMTDHTGRLHEPGDASDRRFIATVKSGSYNLAAYYFQSAKKFTDKNEMCDASFAQDLFQPKTSTFSTLTLI